MRRLGRFIILRFLVVSLFLITISCKKIDKYKTKPELSSLQQGLKTTVSVAYCASVAAAYFKGEPLPDNVSFIPETGLIHVKINRDHPLPFNNNIGDIFIAGLWSGNGGIISILFADIDILEGDIDLYGLHTVPLIEDYKTGDIVAVFAEQDIILGYGTDTILNTDHISDIMIFNETSRCSDPKPTDVFIAVQQNVWFVEIDRNSTGSDLYDDDIIIHGGGQIAEVNSESGGVLYHAMIDTKVNYSECSINPIRGNALSQNVKSGSSIIVDLGNTLFSFHDNCDGDVHVDFASGKYVYYNGKDIPLGFD